LPFVKVAETSELPAGSMEKVEVGGNEILIANVGGKYHAVQGRCTHLRGDLSLGKLAGNVVTCPRHGSQFDVTTGRAIRGPKMLGIVRGTGDLRRFEVQVKGKEILVKTG